VYQSFCCVCPEKWNECNHSYCIAIPALWCIRYLWVLWGACWIWPFSRVPVSIRRWLLLWWNVWRMRGWVIDTFVGGGYFFVIGFLWDQLEYIWEFVICKGNFAS
jgi:hypothetical protein